MNRESRLRLAEWHAFESLKLEAAGDPDEAREHLNDAREQLYNAGLITVGRILTPVDVFAICAEARTECK